MRKRKKRQNARGGGIPPAYKRPYYDPRWRKLRARQLAVEPNCRICGAPATAADHVEAHRGDMRLFFDHKNLQSLCQTCHSRKTNYQDGGFGVKPKGKAHPACNSAGEPLDPDHPWNRE